MPTYRVTWAEDIIAHTPQEAADKALAIQRDWGALSNYFEVRKRYVDGHVEKDTLKQTIFNAVLPPRPFILAAKNHIASQFHYFGPYVQRNGLDAMRNIRYDDCHMVQLQALPD